MERKKQDFAYYQVMTMTDYEKRQNKTQALFSDRKQAEALQKQIERDTKTLVEQHKIQPVVVNIYTITSNQLLKAHSHVFLLNVRHWSCGYPFDKALSVSDSKSQLQEQMAKCSDPGQRTQRKETFNIQQLLVDVSCYRGPDSL